MSSTITQVSLLRDCRVFRDFRWADDPDLDHFGRFNLVYGWNGSGKSTISQLLRSLELRQEPQFGDVQLRVGSREIKGNEFPATPPETVSLKVFNQDFVKDNVFRSDGGEIAPILVVGERSVAAQQQTEDLRQTQSHVQQSLENAQGEKESLQKRLERHCADNAKTLKDRIGEKAGSAYRNYNLPKYQKRADLMIAQDDHTAYHLSESDRHLLTAHQSEDVRPTLTLADHGLPNLTARHSAVAGLMSQTVASRAIQALIDDAKLTDWIRTGLALHEDRQAVDCLYCEQPLPASRLAALNGHFDDAHEQLMQDLDAEIRRCNTAKDSLATLESDLPVREQLYADLAQPYEGAKTTLVKCIGDAQDFLDQLLEDLEQKKTRPFVSLNLTHSPPSLEDDHLSRVKLTIEQHNAKCSDFDAGVKEARIQLEADFVAGHLQDYKALKDAVRRAKDAEREASERAKRIRTKIEELERVVLDHRPPADALNDDLREYLGPGQLQVDVREQGYILVRDGVPANDPSEGEMTAIALLYFLRSLDSSDFAVERGVVVLDDPVSSLDANALYAAAGYIRRRTEHAGQLIILTHNFTLFREMRNWFRHLKGQRSTDPAKRPARF
ncbi:MAG: AAA family ATPase, partial [Chloroflexi bacterium]|nr:AAA family ATPase [Chloroflexota bacterium]